MTQGSPEHPCKGMTTAQRRAFERIATGDACPARVQPGVIARLMERGVIERGPNKVLGRDRFGIVSIPQYFVALRLHAQWCAWCSERNANGEQEQSR